MKEYKVIQANLGLRNRRRKLEDVLNEHAKQGWVLKEIDSHIYFLIFERDKNR